MILLKWTIFVALSLISPTMQDSAWIREEIKSGRKPMHGVNLGSWLVAEPWMTEKSPAWRGVPKEIAKNGEFAAMKYLGHGRGDAQFEEHRRTYFTEQDIAEIASYGLNTIRIPVGYWIVGFDHTWGGDLEGWKVYAPGGLKYLDKAIREWAPRHNLVVLISMHAAKGSQNGEQHSAPQNPPQKYWAQHKENVNNTLDAVTWLARRYKNEPAFLGIDLLNEPAQTEHEQVLKQYYYDAYGRIRNDVGSNCLLVVAPLLSHQYNSASDWMNFMPYPQFHTIRHTWHRYFVWGFEREKGWNTEKILINARYDLEGDIRVWKGNWLFIGEWSLGNMMDMSDSELREFANHQLNSYKKAVGGWTFWSWKHYGDGDNERNVWSLRSMIRRGLLPNKY